MRQAIDGNSRVLKSILLQPAMRKEFLKGVSAGDEGKAVKAFVAMNTENMLKTKPKVSLGLNDQGFFLSGDIWKEVVDDNCHRVTKPTTQISPFYDSAIIPSAGV